MSFQLWFDLEQHWQPQDIICRLDYELLHAMSSLTHRRADQVEIYTHAAHLVRFITMAPLQSPRPAPVQLTVTSQPVNARV